MRKQMLENECKQLRRDMSSIEELKKSAEQQSRSYEQEVCNRLQSEFAWDLSLFKFRNGISSNSCGNSRLS